MAGPEAESEEWLARHIDALREAGPRLLDIGCGEGYDDAVLTRSGFQVVGFDRRPVAVREARDRVADASYVVADVRAGFPVRDAAFDCVLASLSLHYLPWRDTVAAFGQVGRVVRPGGRFLFRVNADDDLNFGADQGVEIEPGLRRYEPGENRRPLKRYFDERGVREALGEGWDIEHLEHRSTWRWGPEKRVWEGRAHKR